MDILDEIMRVDSAVDNETRSRNTRIVDLVEGDILVDGDIYYKVDWGEVSVNADGTIDQTNGELVPVSIEAITIGFTGTLFNMEDVR